MKISIVTTLYHSASYLPDFCQRAGAAAETITNDYEIVLVNDGSPDNALDCALELQKKDSRIKIIDLSRNFGQHKAMMVGLMHANGDLIFLIDCDLEEDPELLKKFYLEIQNSKADVVYGVRDKRMGSLSEKFFSTLFYKIFNFISQYAVPDNILNARLMSRRYVQSLLEHNEREFYMAGLWAITGYKQVSLPVTKHSKGKSSYTLGRKFSICINAITSFSHMPLMFIFYLGCVIMLLSLVAAFILMMKKIFLGGVLVGWSSVMVSIWLLSGIIIFSLGIIGIYLSKIFIETKQRPYAIVRQIYENPIKS